MSKYTAEQARDWHRRESSWRNQLGMYESERKHSEMADAIDALLRERESAKVDDRCPECGAPCEASHHVFESGDELHEYRYVAPMLASAWVPDGCFISLIDPTEEQVSETVYDINRKTDAGTVNPDMVRQVWSGMVHARPIKRVNAMLAAATKPEKGGEGWSVK